MSCNICCDNYNNSNRTKIICSYCDYDACRKCCETYLLSENVAKCMKPDCGKEWTRQFLVKNFTNVFLSKKYKQHIEDVLYDKEKALLPATQLIIEEKNHKKKIFDEIREINKMIRELIVKKDELHYSLDKKITQNVHNFVRQCSSSTCRGFLSSQWKCGLCEQWTCPECHELKGPKRDCEHTCDPNNVETAKLLDKDTKPCPKCQIMITKISGCNQMWCTQCHTAFNWKTGQFEKTVHNPHYYEWHRNNNREPPRPLNEIRCGRVLDHNTAASVRAGARIHNLSLSVWQNNPNGSNLVYDGLILKILEIIQNCIHNQSVELYNFQVNYFEKNQDLRIRYLENKISEYSFKQCIQRNNKKDEFNKEMQQIIELSVAACTDIIYRIIDYLNEAPPNTADLTNFMSELSTLEDYCNQLLDNISSVYRTTYYYKFDNLFEFYKSYYKPVKLTKCDDNDEDEINSVYDNDIHYKL